MIWLHIGDAPGSENLLQSRPVHLRLQYGASRAVSLPSSDIWSMMNQKRGNLGGPREVIVAITIIDPKEVALREKKRTVVMNTRKLHAWVHYYPEPGDHDEMHCHNEDQVFTCFEGQCTMHFPDGGSAVLNPGMAALITGGSFYKLENTGSTHMILMGHRSGSQDNVMIIDYVTRKDIRHDGKPRRASRTTEQPAD